MGVRGQLHTLATLCPVKDPAVYPRNRWLGAALSLSGRLEGKITPLLLAGAKP